MFFSRDHFPQLPAKFAQALHLTVLPWRFMPLITFHHWRLLALRGNVILQSSILTFNQFLNLSVLVPVILLSGVSYVDFKRPR